MDLGFNNDRLRRLFGGTPLGYNENLLILGKIAVDTRAALMWMLDNPDELVAVEWVDGNNNEQSTLKR